MRCLIRLFLTDHTNMVLNSYVSMGWNPKSANLFWKTWNYEDR